MKDTRVGILIALGLGLADGLAMAAWKKGWPVAAGAEAPPAAVRSAGAAARHDGPAGSFPGPAADASR